MATERTLGNLGVFSIAFLLLFGLSSLRGGGLENSNMGIMDIRQNKFKFSCCLIFQNFPLLAEVTPTNYNNDLYHLRNKLKWQESFSM